jgi:hypothetical protein
MVTVPLDGWHFADDLQIVAIGGSVDYPPSAQAWEVRVFARLEAHSIACAATLDFLR